MKQVDKFDSPDNTLDSMLKSKLSDVGAYAKYLRDGVKSLVDYLDYLTENDISLKRDIKISEMVDGTHIISEQRIKLIEMQTYLMGINIYSLDKSYVPKLEEIAAILNQVTDDIKIFRE